MVKRNVGVRVHCKDLITNYQFLFRDPINVQIHLASMSSIALLNIYIALFKIATCRFKRQCSFTDHH